METLDERGKDSVTCNGQSGGRNETEAKTESNAALSPQGKQPGKIIVERRQRKATNDSRQ